MLIIALKSNITAIYSPFKTIYDIITIIMLDIEYNILYISVR
jgi:hypothetical protein